MVNTMTDYGYDLRCATDTTPTMLEGSGLELMADVCCRRLYTPNGTLLSAPGARTTDLRLYIGSTQDRGDRTLGTIRSDATAALKDDERISAVSINIRWEPDESFMELDIDGVGHLGPFALTLRVDSVTVQVLQQ
jgi:hypothetical protein